MAANRWIELEFERTGLPKSGLAGYLGIDNAAVTRIMNGERALTTEEDAHVRAFFSIVPRDATSGSNEASRLRRRDAIQRLRSTKVRETASLALATWLMGRAEEQRTYRDMPTSSHEWYLSMLERIIEGKTSFRSDQIVAVCRLLVIDLNELASGNGVEARNDFAHYCPKDLVRELSTAAADWVERGAVPYQFDRNFNTPGPRPSSVRIPYVVLQPADDAAPQLAPLAPYLVPDDSQAPRFEQGQTIYLDEQSDPRKGDYVAVMFNGSDESSPKATLGKLLYTSRETINIASERNANIEIPKADVASVRRIAYCKY